MNSLPLNFAAGANAVVAENATTEADVQPNTVLPSSQESFASTLQKLLESSTENIDVAMPEQGEGEEVENPLATGLFTQVIQDPLALAPFNLNQNIVADSQEATIDGTGTVLAQAEIGQTLSATSTGLEPADAIANPTDEDAALAQGKLDAEVDSLLDTSQPVLPADVNRSEVPSTTAGELAAVNQPELSAAEPLAEQDSVVEAEVQDVDTNESNDVSSDQTFEQNQNQSNPDSAEHDPSTASTVNTDQAESSLATPANAEIAAPPDSANATQEIRSTNNVSMAAADPPFVVETNSPVSPNSAAAQQTPVAASVQVSQALQTKFTSFSDDPRQSISIELNPPELGQIQITVEQFSDQMVARIVATEFNATELLLNEKDFLLDSLSDLGFGETSLDISHGGSDQEMPNNEQEDGIPRKYKAASETKEPTTNVQTKISGVNFVA